MTNASTHGTSADSSRHGGRADRRHGGAILRRTVRRTRGRMAAGTALLITHQLSETMVPILIGVVVARAIEPGSVTALAWSIAALAALFLLLTTAWRFGARIVVGTMQQEAHLLRVEVAARILDPRGIRTGLRGGELLTVATSDAERESWILDLIGRGTAALAAVVASAVALLMINVPLGLAVLVGTPVVLAAMQLAAPIVTRRVTAQQEAVATTAALATDLVSGLRPLRGLGAERVAADRYRRSSRTALAATLRAAQVTGTHQGASVAVSGLLAVGVAGLAGWFALEGHIGIGELITVVGLAQFVIEPLGGLSRVPSVLATSRASADRLALVLAAEPLLPAGDRPLPPTTDLEVADVTFGSLDGLSFHARPGELLGVLAHRPQDADALARLLSGHVPPGDRTGVVTVGGVPLADIALADARRTLLVEPHDTDLFAGTIGANVAAGLVDVDTDTVRRVLDASAATDVVDAHPDGLDARVTDRGASLSGGQRQRVALARALLARTPVLVLHDPTTAVDAVTEQVIADGIADLRHRGTDRAHTTILITSSPALLAAADRVLVIEDGAVTVQGRHTDLVASDETYRKVVLR